MIRAQYKDESYFKAFIDSQEKRIDKFEKTIRIINPDEVDKVRQCKSYICSFYWDLVSAKYSMGFSKEEIANDVLALFSYFTSVNSYNEMINYLSFAILFDISGSNLDAIIDNEEYDDPLVGKLKAYFCEKQGAHSDALLYPNYSKPFFDFLNNVIDLKTFIKYIDEEWYDSCKDLYFYDSHKNSNQTYTGYWCWLAAAILKMKSEKAVFSSFIPTDLI